MSDYKRCDNCQGFYERGAKGSWDLTAASSTAHYDLCSGACVQELILEGGKPTV